MTANNLALFLNHHCTRIDLFGFHAPSYITLIYFSLNTCTAADLN